MYTNFPKVPFLFERHRLINLIVGLTFIQTKLILLFGYHKDKRVVIILTFSQITAATGQVNSITILVCL